MSEAFILDNRKYLKYGGIPWLMAYMALGSCHTKISGNFAVWKHC